MTLPIPVIVFLVIWQVLNFLGLGCFLWDSSHKNYVPEKRYEGHEKRWWWTAVLTTPLSGFAYIFFHIVVLKNKKK